MQKRLWKPGTMLYPLPAVMLSCGEFESQGKTDKLNIITVSWAGTICSEPAMLSVSIRPSRHSYEMIASSKEFVVNLTTKKLAFATDYCGVKSGRDTDKFKQCKLTPQKGNFVKAPLIAESPVNIECSVEEIIKLGSHDMFIAKVLGINVAEEFIDKNGSFDMKAADLIAYSHGQYYQLGKELGHFGFSVKKKK